MSKKLQETVSRFSEESSDTLYTTFVDIVTSTGFYVAISGIAAGVLIFAFLIVPAMARIILPPPKDTRLADYLPFAKLLKDGKTLLTRKGTAIQCIEVEGHDSTFLTPGEREAQSLARKNWVDTLSEIGVTIRVFVLREKIDADKNSDHINPVLNKIYHAWNKSFQNSYRNRQIIVISASSSSQKQTINKLGDAVDCTLTALSDYNPRILNQDIEQAEGDLSKLLLSFWGQIISPITKPTPIIDEHVENISEVLTADIVEFGGEEGDIVFQSGRTKRHMAVIGIRKFGDYSEEQMISDLQNIDIEYTLLHLIEPWSKSKATLTLLQQNRMASAIKMSDAVKEQYDVAMEAVEGMDETAQSLSRYSLAIFIYADTIAEVEKATSDVRRICATFGATAIREGVACQASWFSQFPTFEKWPRAYKFFSRNLATLVTLAKMPEGLPRSDWGDGPIALFRTAGGTVYNFQYHVSTEKDAVAHGVTIGPTGGGKTTLMCFLAAMAMRHEKLRTYVFDRYQGAYVFCQAAQGSYITFNSGPSDDNTGNTSLNPFQCQDTDENRHFLRQWLKNISGCEDARSQEEIGLAVSENFDSLTREQRSLRSVFEVCFTPDGKVKEELKKWIDPTLYGDMFNSERDTLDLSTSRLTAFDFTRIFEDENLTRAALSYLMHRIQSTITEYQCPALLFIDETEPMLRHPLFRQYFLVMLQEYRKRGAAVISAFQRPEAISATGMSETIRGQAQTVYFLPNPQAQERDYADWDLSDREWAFITGKLSLSKRLKRAILIKRATGESVVLDVDLSPLGSYINIFSSGRASVRMATDMQKEFGKGWVEHYLNAMK